MKPLQVRTRFAMTSMGALLAAMLVAGCGDDSNPAAPEATFEDPAADARVEQVLAETKRYEDLAKSPDGGVAALIQENERAGGSLVIVPAGSVDALAGALAAAGNGGIVLLKSGMHTESGSVTITKTVNLIGETGAILEVDTDPFPIATFNEPGLHVKNAARVLIWGIDLRPKQTSGNTAIFSRMRRLPKSGSARSGATKSASCSTNPTASPSTETRSRAHPTATTASRS